MTDQFIDDKLCDKCHKEITVEDFESEDHAYMCAKRGFLGEGFRNWCWKAVERGKGNYFDNTLVYSLCLKCRDGFTMVGQDPTPKLVKRAKRWVKDMLKLKEADES